MTDGRQQYGENEDGSWSVCRALPENVGRYNCRHVSHAILTAAEAQEKSEKAIAASVKAESDGSLKKHDSHTVLGINLSKVHLRRNDLQSAMITLTTMRNRGDLAWFMDAGDDKILEHDIKDVVEESLESATDPDDFDVDVGDLGHVHVYNTKNHYIRIPDDHGVETLENNALVLAAQDEDSPMYGVKDEDLVKIIGDPSTRKSVLDALSQNDVFFAEDDTKEAQTIANDIAEDLSDRTWGWNANQTDWYWKR